MFLLVSAASNSDSNEHIQLGSTLPRALLVSLASMRPRLQTNCRNWLPGCRLNVVTSATGLVFSLRLFSGSLSFRLLRARGRRLGAISRSVWESLHPQTAALTSASCAVLGAMSGARAVPLSAALLSQRPLDSRFFRRTLGDYNPKHRQA